MRIKNLYKIIFLLLLAFFNVSGIHAHAFNSGILTLDPKNSDYLQEDQNTAAHLLEEITTGGLVQIVAQNYFASGKNPFNKYEFHKRKFSSHSTLTHKFIPNKRSILEASIFPYHFFW